MQKTEDGYRWTIRLSKKDYSQKEVLRMFEYLLGTGEYATESDIFREGIKSLYREKTEPDEVIDWDNRIKECAVATADVIMERMRVMLEGITVARLPETDTDVTAQADVPATVSEGMKPPQASEELGEGVSDFLSTLYGDI